MAPPSADVADLDMEEDEGVANGVSNGSGYVSLSENRTDLHDDATGYHPVGNGVINGDINGGVDGSDGAVRVERPMSQGTVVNVNGVEVTVYGNIQGLEFLNLGNGDDVPGVDVDGVDDEEEEEEARRRVEAERAIREAEEADVARRSAPLPAEQCQTIRNAMRGITLDFRPDWAGSVPEQEWMSRILESGGSAHRRSSLGDGGGRSSSTP